MVILRVHIHGGPEYEIGNEIWHQSLAEVIATEAQTIAGYAAPALLDSPDQAHRDTLREQIICDMGRALVGVGDEYQAPDGVRYSLLDESVRDADTRGTVNPKVDEPVVTEVLRFEDLPVGSAASRRAIVRWSDGTQSEALTFYSDLCGHPHKPAYPERRVMPRSPSSPLPDRYDGLAGRRIIRADQFRRMQSTDR
jgi:hypothetical protein